ncbi:GNAT family N-acetyltransferase [Paenibacillus selenitireducens]|uniref:GNAT family N-acetyltransferase n=1 Tax=Paenibacillus selenitireducens TaxID=1324314 RepID=A0A1T2X3X5_9BACL|nr:GNAT family protein [Paenibacillus selenitireducens]OPA74598.1 GNAT family N-acetyltransferase [Paenibacillus selenitireducens]
MQLETERLVLRDFTREDWISVHAYSSNKQVTQYMLWGPNSEEDTKAYIEQMIRSQQEIPRQSYELAVTLKGSGELIGGCGLVLHRSNGEVGYCFHPDAWGKGYATEAAQALVTFGFQGQELHRIYATCRPDNVGSANVMRKMGMKQEGHLREHRWAKEKYHDSYLFSILRQEYQAIAEV